MVMCAELPNFVTKYVQNMQVCANCAVSIMTVTGNGGNELPS